MILAEVSYDTVSISDLIIKIEIGGGDFEDEFNNRILIADDGVPPLLRAFS